MTPLAVLTWFVACNRAPVDYVSDASAPGSKYPWSHPSEGACADAGEAGDEVIDGFSYCREAEAKEKIPVDDPIYTACAELDPTAVPPNGQVLYVFDGVLARAYPLDLLDGREIVNDLWRDQPIAVDY